MRPSLGALALFTDLLPGSLHAPLIQANPERSAGCGPCVWRCHCHSAWGPNADRRGNFLNCLREEGSNSKADSHDVPLVGPGPAYVALWRPCSMVARPWIPERSATCLREADLNVLSKLGNQGLEWRLEPEAFTRREVRREDDLLDILVGCPIDIQVAWQPST